MDVSDVEASRAVMTILASRTSDRSSSLETLENGSNSENMSFRTGAVLADRSGLAEATIAFSEYCRRRLTFAHLRALPAIA